MVFVGIIILSSKNPVNGPGLKQVDESALVTTTAHFLGAKDAPVVLTEFSDFSCPACKGFHPVIKQLAKLYPTTLKIIYRHFPLPIPGHELSPKAAQAAEAAGAQNKFWEYADLLFDNQPNFSNDQLISYAKELNLDVDLFKKELDSEKYAAIVSADIATGNSLGINATPTFFLNNRFMAIKDFNDFQDQVAQAVEAIDTEQSSETKPITKLNTVLEISFDANGFVPQNSGATLGQTVRWTNKSTNTLVLTQTGDTFSELAKPREIKPNESFDLILYKNLLWSYKDAQTEKVGSILIKN